MKLGLLRDGKPLEVEVTLDSNTSSSASAEMIAPALQGATLSDGQLKDGTKGVKVDSVEKSSPAAQAGLQKMMLSSALIAIASVLSPKCAK
ncbi:serine protease [Salmonella enterica subsp. enterica]|nr:serine protease [Salmonella enterica subsp. enterica]